MRQPQMIISHGRLGLPLAAFSVLDMRASFA
jgi:hypothetical protein